MSIEHSLGGRQRNSDANAKNGKFEQTLFCDFLYNAPKASQPKSFSHFTTVMSRFLALLAALCVLFAGAIAQELHTEDLPDFDPDDVSGDLDFFGEMPADLGVVAQGEEDDDDEDDLANDDDAAMVLKRGVEGVQGKWSMCGARPSCRAVPLTDS